MLRSALRATRWPRTIQAERLQWRGALVQSRTASSTSTISPTLLNRARAVAREHEELIQQSADGYDADIAKRTAELARTATRLKEYDEAQRNLENLMAMYGEDKEMDAAIDEEKPTVLADIDRATDALTASLVPIHPFAHLPCLLEIRPGAGGDEAALFAFEMLQMYEAWCSRHGLSTSLAKLETSDGSAAASAGTHLQEAILEVNTSEAYDKLRTEAGVHRVQRVPATESKGRTHTSAVSVLVLPSMPTDPGQGLSATDYEDPNSDYYVDPTDVRIDVMRARGAGGQHVNTTDSAVRLTHIPSNTVVAVRESRSQLKNRETAWQILRSRLAQQKRDEREAEIVRLRRGAGAGKVGRENKIRTYNWGQQRVTDHRSGYESRRLDDVMAGGEPLDAVMESVRKWMSDQEVLALEHEAS